MHSRRRRIHVIVRNTEAVPFGRLCIAFAWRRLPRRWCMICKISDSAATDCLHLSNELRLIIEETIESSESKFRRNLRSRQFSSDRVVLDFISIELASVLKAVYRTYTAWRATPFLCVFGSKYGLPKSWSSRLLVINTCLVVRYLYRIDIAIFGQLHIDFRIETELTSFTHL